MLFARKKRFAHAISDTLNRDVRLPLSVPPKTRDGANEVCEVHVSLGVPSRYEFPSASTKSHHVDQSGWMNRSLGWGHERNFDRLEASVKTTDETQLETVRIHIDLVNTRLVILEVRRSDLTIELVKRIVRFKNFVQVGMLFRNGKVRNRCRIVD